MVGVFIPLSAPIQDVINITTEANLAAFGLGRFIAAEVKSADSVFVVVFDRYFCAHLVLCFPRILVL